MFERKGKNLRWGKFCVQILQNLCLSQGGTDLTARNTEERLLTNRFGSHTEQIPLVLDLRQRRQPREGVGLHLNSRNKVFHVCFPSFWLGK